MKHSRLTALPFASTVLHLVSAIHKYVCTGGASAMDSPYHECLGKAAPLVWIDMTNY